MGGFACTLNTDCVIMKERGEVEIVEIRRGVNSFFVGDSEDKPLAAMTFVLTDEDVITVEHTYVADELRGQGVGRVLLEQVADWARRENKKVRPLCPYAKAQMEKDERYRDVLHP
jgi:predicted GNAT family acetyltransferase